MLRAFRLTQKRLQPLARARAERRQYTVEELSGNKWHFPDEDGSRATYTHKSDGMQNVRRMPVIEVEGKIARTNGGRMEAGHPQVYYQLDTATGGPITCKWSGLRFQMKEDHH